MAENFSVNGGKYLFLDEIHKYENWAQEIKNIYDDFPELNVVFTGSSMLQINNSKADLSRRVAYYNMYGMSFREYINFGHNKNIPPISLNDIPGYNDASSICSAYSSNPQRFRGSIPVAAPRAPTPALNIA